MNKECQEVEQAVPGSRNGKEAQKQEALQEKFDDIQLYHMEVVASLVYDSLEEVDCHLDYYISNPDYLKQKIRKMIGGVGLIERMAEKAGEFF